MNLIDNQSASRRAWEESWKFLLSTKIGWIIGVVLAGVISAFFVGNNPWERFLSGFTGSIISIVVIITIIYLLQLLIAPYKQRNEARKRVNELLNATQENDVVVLKQPPELFIEINNVEFGLSGNSKYQGFPQINSQIHETRWIRLGINFKGNVFVETLELIISGKAPIQAYEWKPGELAYYHYFQIPRWVKANETRTIQVLAFANGIKWGSSEMTINFPVLCD